MQTRPDAAKNLQTLTSVMEPDTDADKFLEQLLALHENDEHFWQNCSIVLSRHRGSLPTSWDVERNPEQTCPFMSTCSATPKIQSDRNVVYKQQPCSTSGKKIGYLPVFQNPT